MDTFEQPQNDLESAIAAAADDVDGSARREVIRTLSKATVAVLLDAPLTQGDMSEPVAHPMYVSDGANQEQAMLAVFSSNERAVRFHEEHGGFNHPAEVFATRAILATTPDAGIFINPNQPLGFRILPALAAALKSKVLQAMELASVRTQSDHGSGDE